MRVVLCAIAKNEHDYINEWVNHYLSIGFDDIYIYDNDDVNSPYIGDYIDKRHRPKVHIINIRGQHEQFLQHKVYNDFYHNNDFSWVFYCDIDEYISGIKDIKQFLSNKKFDRFSQIRVKWALFGDDDKITRDTNENIYGYFKNIIVNHRLANQGKSFIRGGLNIQINSCHYVKNLESCYPSGNKCQSNSLDLLFYNNETIFLFHYMTKTLSEFVKQKLNRGDAVWQKRNIDLDYYWRINRKTKEKLDYLKNLGLID